MTVVINGLKYYFTNYKKSSKKPKLDELNGSTNGMNGKWLIVFVDQTQIANRDWMILVQARTSKGLVIGAFNAEHEPLLLDEGGGDFEFGYL